MTEKTYHIVTFGCQMNERDSETLAGMLEAQGYSRIEEKKDAQVVLLNTCSVRENADKRFFGVLGQLKHAHEADPRMVVGVCGCMMQQQHIIDELKKRYPWVDLVFGTHNIADFPKLFSAVTEQKSHIIEVLENAGEIVEDLPAKREYPFKAYVNITYGCNNFCTYCIVPYTRGRERSRRPEEIIKEVRGLVESGCKEITLLGQNVNSYGNTSYCGSYCYKEENGPDFAGLLRQVDAIEGLERLRFMTSHPKDLSEDLIQCFADCKHLCRAIHLPVQCGSNEILRRMNRRYTREQYLELIDRLRAVCPDIAISTDIIVGFPGETEKDFLDTLDLADRVKYDSAFTFIYSVRKGTPAAEYPDQVPEEVKHERLIRLTEVIHRHQEAKSLALQDAVLPVLIEGPSKTDKTMLTGRTEGGKTVDLPAPAELIGQIVPVRITKAQTFSLYGELLCTR